MTTLTEAAIAAIKALMLADPAGLENALQTIADSDAFDERRRDKTREALKRLRDEGEFAGVALKSVFGLRGPKPGTADPSRGIEGTRPSGGALDHLVDALGRPAAVRGDGTIWVANDRGQEVQLHEYIDVVEFAASGRIVRADSPNLMGNGRDNLGRARTPSSPTRDAFGRARSRGASARDGFGRAR